MRQLSDVCDAADIPVMTYGLRTDFQGNLFAGSEALLAWADSIIEIKTICHCGRKATMVLRIDTNGKVIKLLFRRSKPSFAAILCRPLRRRGFDSNGESL